MDADTIGKVRHFPWEREFEWKIEGFTTLSKEDDTFYYSPLFYFANAYWRLKIYPNGQKHNKSTGFISLYLVRKSSGPPISLDFTLFLKTLYEETDRVKDFSCVFEGVKSYDGYGTIKLLRKSEFLDVRSELDLPDILSVICTIRNLEATRDATFEKLSNDLKEMMLSGNNSDTIVKVKGKEFKLHRNILMARNPYFNSMFKNDMKEKSTGIVTIDDCEPDIFRTLVLFIYTGQVNKLSKQNVCELYETTDKYQEDELKNDCLEFMMKAMSKDTFYDFIALALRYDEKKLFEKAVEFFVSKPIEIFRSEKWQNFAKDYPTQANELILKTLNHHVK